MADFNFETALSEIEDASKKLLSFFYSTMRRETDKLLNWGMKCVLRSSVYPSETVFIKIQFNFSEKLPWDGNQALPEFVCNLRHE